MRIVRYSINLLETKKEGTNPMGSVVVASKALTKAGGIGVVFHWVFVIEADAETSPRFTALAKHGRGRGQGGESGYRKERAHRRGQRTGIGRRLSSGVPP